MVNNISIIIILFKTERKQMRIIKKSMKGRGRKEL